MAGTPAYKRVLLKLSGEALAGSGGLTVEPSICQWIAADIAAARAMGVQFGIVIGGGNIFRGASLARDGMNRPHADSIGMLATVINSLVLQSHLQAAGVPCVTFCANAIDKIAPAFTASAARSALDSGTVVLIAGGTGNPFFTTDTAAALRCAEIGAQVLCKATKVDGIYDSDPIKNPAAVHIPRLDYSEALSRNLRVMDATAFSFCMENAIPIVVFKLVQGNLRRCVQGEPVGSIVTEGANHGIG